MDNSPSSAGAAATSNNPADPIAACSPQTEGVDLASGLKIPPIIGFGLQWRATGQVEMPDLRLTSPASTASPPQSSIPKLFFRKVVNPLATLFSGTALACTGLVLLSALSEYISDSSISIQEISVPKILADYEYTSLIAAQRLRDEMNNFVRRVTIIDSMHIGTPGDSIKITVPGLNTTTSELATNFLRTFHLSSKKFLSGEIISIEKKLWLRLRLDGDLIYKSSAGIDIDRPDDLWPEAMQSVFDHADSYVSAASYKSNPKKSLRIAEFGLNDTSIFNRHRRSKFHNIIGNRLLTLGEPNKAELNYEIAKIEDPKFPLAYHNLGLLFTKNKKLDEAKNEFIKAISLDHKYSAAHNGLGVVLF